MGKGPGKYYRKGISLLDLTKRFPNDGMAEDWFVRIRWPNGVRCPACKSSDVQSRPKRKPQPYRCRKCRKDFSMKTGTLMQGSNLGYQKWAIEIYLFATGMKGTSSMKLHRDLGITQKSAWYLAVFVPALIINRTVPATSISHPHSRLINNQMKRPIDVPLVPIQA